jgi:tetratricopeptide (TPR) repeat protein
MIASICVHMNQSVSPEALTWLSLGLDSDVASSRLKLASVYYCVGDWYNAEIVLRNVEEKYIPLVVENYCGCHPFPKPYILKLLAEYSRINGLISFKDIFAFCVRYLPIEIHCVPHELQYEMFRSTPEDLPYRRPDDCWMDWAVVDSIPYLYFLQYKTYGHLQRYDDQQQALNNLIRTTFTGLNFGHRETALNLLGQCMEQENRHNEAFYCYTMSLNNRRRNNAAKVHICRLLGLLVRSGCG